MPIRNIGSVLRSRGKVLDEVFSYDSPYYFIITGSTTGVQDNYQFMFIMNYGSMNSASTGHTVNCGSMCNTDFSGIYFMDSRRNELSFYIDQKTDSDKATVWVNLTTIPVGTIAETIYLYWNGWTPPNSGELSTIPHTFNTHGSLTFPDFFDDFDGTILDSSKWTITNIQGVGQSSWATVNNGSLQIYSTVSSGQSCRVDIISKQWLMSERKIFTRLTNIYTYGPTNTSWTSADEYGFGGDVHTEELAILKQKDSGGNSVIVYMDVKRESGSDHVYELVPPLTLPLTHTVPIFMCGWSGSLRLGSWRVETAEGIFSTLHIDEACVPYSSHSMPVTFAMQFTSTGADAERYLRFEKVFCGKYVHPEPVCYGGGIGNPTELPYRMYHEVTSSSGSGTTATSIVVYRSIGTSSGSTLYLPRCREDYLDIRFKDTLGTSISFYNSGTVAPLSTIWFNIPETISSGGTYGLYIYYGWAFRDNGSGSTIGNGSIYHSAWGNEETLWFDTTINSTLSVGWSIST